MPRRLFTVTDVFLIRGRGVVLVPGITPTGDERFRIGDPLVLKRPDGSEIRTTIGGLDIFTCTTRPEIPLLLKGLGKDDVPLATEVWSDNSAEAQWSAGCRVPREDSTHEQRSKRQRVD